MSWHDYDEKLIRRGELILDLGFVRNYQAELDAMNRGKEGRASPSGSPTPTSSSSPL